MSRFTVALLAAMLSTSAFAAKDPCKGVKVKKDAFGSTRVAEVGDFKVKQVQDGWALSLGFNHGGGYGAFTANSMEQLPEGTIVEVLMADGSKLELESVGSTGPKLVSVMGVSVTHFDMAVGVDKAKLELLTSQEVKAFRIMRGAEAWHTSEIKKGDAKKFQEVGSCMIST
jgi:hypothetical protein